MPQKPTRLGGFPEERIGLKKQMELLHMGELERQLQRYTDAWLSHGLVAGEIQESNPDRRTIKMTISW